MTHMFTAAAMLALLFLAGTSDGRSLRLVYGEPRWDIEVSVPFPVEVVSLDEKKNALARWPTI
jgi:hypothetical protein